METIKTVFNKLFDKVELKSEKYDFALIDDLVKKYDSIKSDSDSQSLKARKAAQDLDEVSSRCKSILKEIQQAQKIADQVAKSAEDLGVGLPNEARVAVTQLDAYRSDLSELASRAEKAGDAIFAML